VTAGRRRASRRQVAMPPGWRLLVTPEKQQRAERKRRDKVIAEIRREGDIEKVRRAIVEADRHWPGYAWLVYATGISAKRVHAAVFTLTDRLDLILDGRGRGMWGYLR